MCIITCCHKFGSPSHLCFIALHGSHLSFSVTNSQARAIRVLQLTCCYNALKKNRNSLSKCIPLRQTRKITHKCLTALINRYVSKTHLLKLDLKSAKRITSLSIKLIHLLKFSLEMSINPSKNYYCRFLSFYFLYNMSLKSFTSLISFEPINYRVLY